MSTNVTFNSAHRVLLASEFFITRRPIVDRHSELAMHDLALCSVGAASHSPAPYSSSSDDYPAKASVIADVYQHGITRVVGKMRALVHIDGEALMSDIFSFLPAPHVLLAVKESIAAAPETLPRISALVQQGFAFAVETDGPSPALQHLLPVAALVRSDIRGKPPHLLEALCTFCKMHQKKVLAEQVQTSTQFNTCFDLGFDYFQGYYFAQPRQVPGKAFNPSQRAIMELLALLASDADSSEIERSMKRDIALGLNLLRLANTPALTSHPVGSLKEALMVLGRNQLQKWLQVMLYTHVGTGKDHIGPLLSLASTRGKLLELAARKNRPSSPSMADTAFTVGIMSLMDALFGIPMHDILEEIPVVNEVKQALLHRSGYYGSLLKLAEYTEAIEQNAGLLQPLIAELRLTHNDLYMLQLAAFEWSDHVVGSV